MTHRLTIQLFGRFHLTHSSAVVDLAQRPRLQALLAYLILHPPGVPRQQIVAALWPESDEATGRNRLRNLLYQLRQRLPNADSFLRIDATTIAWRQDALAEIDVVRFTAVLQEAAAQPDPQQREQLLAQAIALYQGDLFPDCYDEWMEVPRKQLHRALLDAYDQVIALAEGRQDWPMMQIYAERLLSYEPYRESTYCRLMICHAYRGNRAGVMETYRHCRTMLARKFATQPAETTQALYNELVLGGRTE